MGIHYAAQRQEAHLLVSAGEETWKWVSCCPSLIPWKRQLAVEINQVWPVNSIFQQEYPHKFSLDHSVQKFPWALEQKAKKNYC